MMNRFILFFIMVIPSHVARVQELPPVIEQQLEDAMILNEELEDDAFSQSLQHYNRNPINLNAENIEELKELPFITDILVHNLIKHKKVTGPLLSIYELQAIPGWSIQIIQKVRPYVVVIQPSLTRNEMIEQLKNGEHQIQFRITHEFKPKTTTEKTYLGNPQKLYFRYKYNYKNKLQFGCLGDKDAGEQFFRGSQKAGFDFYSYHLQVNGKGVLQKVVLGDFTVNMGQGLIQWQSMAFGKGAEVMNLKRQSPVLKAYQSAGEFNFHRGVGITMQKGKIQITTFASRRRLTANIERDTIYNKEYVTSIIASGYHRTYAELDDKNKLHQTTLGSVVCLKGGLYRVGLNAVKYILSMPLKRNPEPYNLYSVKGSKWSNLGADFSITWKNLHSFGELAFDNHLNKAFLIGCMLSVDPRIDLSILYRSISPAYQAMGANGFIESTQVNNESGIYAGVSIRPGVAWRVTAYADLFQFPWLKYQVHAPSGGNEYMIQLNYSPQKQVELYIRFRTKEKGDMGSGDSTIIPFVVERRTKNWRMHLGVNLTRALTFRARVEILTIDNKIGPAGTGFLTYSEIFFRPFEKSFGGSIRLQIAETNDYDSRIYAYEDDGTPGGSTVSHWGKCFRYYLSFNHKLTKKFTYSFRWAHTLPAKMSFSPLDSGRLDAVGKGALNVQVTLVI